MRTIRLRYSQQKLHPKLQLKTLLLTFITTIFLTGCGIKGDLYQTPEQAISEKEQSDANKAQENSNNSLESEKQPAIEQPTEQVTEQSLEPATESVKEPE